MLVIPGFVIEQLVHRTATSLVYRVRRDDGGTRFIAKLPARERPTPLDAAQLRHEDELLCAIAASSVVRSHGLVPCPSGSALILEDVGSRSLRTVIEAGRPDLRTALRFACRLAHAVASVHRHRVVHKDLKPEHFLLRDDEGSVTLIDFGIATRLSVEAPAFATEFAGSLAYISPEQTGRMNRPCCPTS